MPGVVQTSSFLTAVGYEKVWRVSCISFSRITDHRSDKPNRAILHFTILINFPLEHLADLAVIGMSLTPHSVAYGYLDREPLVRSDRAHSLVPGCCVEARRFWVNCCVHWLAYYVPLLGSLQQSVPPCACPSCWTLLYSLIAPFCLS